MAITVGFGGQVKQVPVFDASGSIAAGGTSQLALARSRSRSYLTIQNLHSSSYLYIMFGSARATATISNGKVTSCTITNGGFGFTYAPLIEFIGGGNGGITPFLGGAQPNYPAPGFSEGGGLPTVVGDKPARAHCVLTGGVVTSIVIDDPGQGYVSAPLVQITNDMRDPNGAADPYYNSTPQGTQLWPGGSMTQETSFVTTDQVAIWGNVTDQAYTLLYSP